MKTLKTVLLSTLLIGSQAFAQTPTTEHREQSPKIQQLRAQIKESRKAEMQKERGIRHEIREERRKEHQERRLERRTQHQEK